MQSITQLVLNSQTMGSPAAAFGLWKALVDVLFEVELPEGTSAGAFHLLLDAWRPGPLLIGRCESVAQTFRRTPQAIARWGVEHYLVQLYTRGGYVGNADGRRVEVRAGDISVLDMLRPFATQAEDFENISVIIPRMLLAPLVDTPDGLHGTVICGTEGLGAVLADHLDSLMRRTAQLQYGDWLRLVEGTMTLLASCLGVRASVHASRGGAGAHSSLLLRVRQYVDSNLASPALSAEALCRDVGLSRSSLQRLFASSGGFMHYVRERRLRRSYAQVADPDGPRISQIAYRWCFLNDSAYSRAFRRCFGQSPRDVRLLAQQRAVHESASSTGQVPQEPGDLWLAHWVLGLTADPA